MARPIDNHIVRRLVEQLVSSQELVVELLEELDVDGAAAESIKETKRLNARMRTLLKKPRKKSP